MTAPPATDIPSLLGLLASRGDRPALSFYRGKALEGRLSYGELVARVEAVAGALHARCGVRSGDRVAILSPNRLEIPVLVLALLRLGAVVVPLNPAASAEDGTYVLRHAAARRAASLPCAGARLRTDDRADHRRPPGFHGATGAVHVVPGDPDGSGGSLERRARLVADVARRRRHTRQGALAASPDGVL